MDESLVTPSKYKPENGPYIPRSYRITDCCENCKFARVVEAPHDTTEYYCNIDNDEPPYVMYKFRGDKIENQKALDYLHWAGFHSVSCDGICDEYKRKGDELDSTG